MNVDQNFPPMTEEEKQRIINDWGGRGERRPQIDPAFKEIFMKPTEPPAIPILVNVGNDEAIKKVDAVFNEVCKEYNKLVLDGKKRALRDVQPSFHSLSEAIKHLEETKRLITEMRDYIAAYKAKETEEQAKFNILIGEITKVK